MLVVSHSSAIRLALCRLIGMPLKDYRRPFPALGNCALTELRLRAGRAALLKFNTPPVEARHDPRARGRRPLRPQPPVRRRPAPRGPGRPRVRELDLPWPVEPLGRVAEVDEASGTEEELIEALDGAEVCVTQLAPLTEKILGASPDPRLFGISRGGPVNANLEAATEHGVAVTFAPGRNATATAEHTLAMMLAATRRVPQTHTDLAGGTWRGDYYRSTRGSGTGGQHRGLVGYGAIGRRVARMLAGVGAPSSSRPVPRAGVLGGLAELVELDELLARARFVTLHARATPENTGMIGAAQLARCPRVDDRELRPRVAAGLRRGLRRAGLRAPVRRRVRRVPGGAVPPGRGC